MCNWHGTNPVSFSQNAKLGTACTLSEYNLTENWIKGGVQFEDEFNATC